MPDVETGRGDPTTGHAEEHVIHLDLLDEQVELIQGRTLQNV
jgi:hypothetical protein